MAKEIYNEEEFDEEFKEWIINFGKDKMPSIYSLLEKHKDKNIIIFRSHSEVNAYVIKQN